MLVKVFIESTCNSWSKYSYFSHTYSYIHIVTDCSISTLVTLVALTLFTKDSCLHNMIHKWKGRKTNFIIRSICHTIVFFLLFFVVFLSCMSRKIKYGTWLWVNQWWEHESEGVLSTHTFLLHCKKKVHLEDSFPLPSVFFLCCPCTADRPGAGGKWS